MRSKFLSRTTAAILSAAVTVPMIFSTVSAVPDAGLKVCAADSAGISYAFAGTRAGYAEGTITFKAESAGTYKLYWADDARALDGYFPIGEFTLKAGGQATVKMGYHTAIPVDAKKIIAATSSRSVSDAAFVYDIPSNKQLSPVSGNLLYTFSTYSDLHIDKRSGDPYWAYAENNLKNAFNLSAKKNADYVVISGDCATCENLDKEWEAYQKILSQSDFVNPVWESNGNHDLKAGVSSGLSKFIAATGTDGSKNSKSYFSMIEEKTGDLFIFMSLELSKDPNKEDVFSDDQLAWAKNLIQQNYTKRNIFLVEHAPVKGYCAGDRLDDPYYGGLMDPKYTNNGKFKQMLKDYPNIIFLSGHTHEDFTMDYNYFDANGEAASMIHTPALAGSTLPNDDHTALNYNNGHCEYTQGYFAQVYENEIIFNGLSVTDELIYPQYSYIMEGARTSETAVNEPAAERPLKNKTVDITNELAKAKAVLSDNYKYSSYDSYQAVKKLYYKYKGQTQADESVIDEFEEKLNALAAYTGGTVFYPYRDTYYFVNNAGWSSVYLYAWDGSTKNAEWPGMKLSKSGTDSNGKDIYKVAFNRTGEYPKIIFNNGSNDKQTVDIELSQYQYNGFSIGSASSGKYKVNNLAVEGTGSDEPVIVDPPVSDNRYALLYYIDSEHGWSDIDTFLQPDGTGLYKLTYTPKNSKTFSCSLYDKTEKKYYCLSTSARFTFTPGVLFEYTLEEHSSRGKSITVDGLSETNVLDITYLPSTKQIRLDCRDASVQVEPLVNNSRVNSESIKLGEELTLMGYAQGGTAPYTYEYSYMKSTDTAFTKIAEYSSESSQKFQPASDGTYTVRISVKDSKGEFAQKDITVAVAAPALSLSNKSSVSDAIVSVNTEVTMTGNAAGGTEPYKFAYYYKKSTESSWSKAYVTDSGSAYTNKTSVVFKPTSAGTYNIRINVKDNNGTGTVVIKEFTLIVKGDSAPLANNSAISATTVNVNDTVTMTGKATGGTEPYKFAYYYKKSTDSSWTKAYITPSGSAYTKTTSVSFTPASSGTYDVRINAKDNNGTGTVVTKEFTVKVKSSAALKNSSSISASSVSVNTEVTMTGAASGGSEPYKFAYYYKKSTDSSWTKAYITPSGSSYTKKTSISFKPASAGTYNVRINVKDDNGTGTTVMKDFTVTVK